MIFPLIISQSDIVEAFGYYLFIVIYFQTARLFSDAALNVSMLNSDVLKYNLR